MTSSSTCIPSFPCLPLISLQTAEDSTTHNILKGKHTVIDFWTTKCTRCPAALDRLNERAKEASHQKDVQFLSIVCDKLDGAREILERDDELRWNNLDHYFMEHEDKEQAKKILGFKSVPFYVVLDQRGEIVQLGNKINWDAVPGCAPKVVENKENTILPDNLTPIKAAPEKVFSPVKSVDVTAETERSFVLDDLDF